SADPPRPRRTRTPPRGRPPGGAPRPGGRGTLAAALRADPEPLLPTAVARASAPDAIEHESARVRVLRPGGSSDHWIVEPREPRSLLDADPELLRELADALQLAARRLAAQAGACRIEPLRVQEGAPLRWHLVAV